MIADGEGEEDKAWVRIATPLAPADLAAFCEDAERLLRINSLYEFEAWREQADGYVMRARNLSNGCTIETRLRVARRVDGVLISYGEGLKTATVFSVEAPREDEAVRFKSCRSVLVVTDDYSGTPETERRARHHEIDASLVQWGRDLHRYLRHWTRWSRFPFWRWYMRRVWQPMRPVARRVTFALLVIAAFELAATLAVVVLFALGVLHVA